MVLEESIGEENWKGHGVGYILKRNPNEKHHTFENSQSQSQTTQ
jgi:hypothetical protein